MLRRRNGARRRQSQALRRFPWRRWTALIVLVGLAALAWWGSQQLLAPGRFPLRYVYFRGQVSHLSRAELRALVADQLGRNFFHLDLTALQQRFTVRPWIASASVRRLWPDSLEVRLRERQAVAYWNQTQLLDARGQPFQPAHLPANPSWPQLRGPVEQAAVVWAQYQRFSRVLAPLGLHLVQLSEGIYGAWSGQLDSGLKLELGRHQVQARLQRFVLLYPRVLQPRLAELAGVDLRYHNGAALSWSQLPAGANPVAHKSRHGSMLAVAD